MERQVGVGRLVMFSVGAIVALAIGADWDYSDRPDLRPKGGWLGGRPAGRGDARLPVQERRRGRGLQLQRVFGATSMCWSWT